MPGAVLDMMSAIAFIISPRTSIISAIIFGSIGWWPPIMAGPIIEAPPVIIWRHISIGIMPPEGVDTFRQ
jgi:hypothetical protein